MIGVKFGCKLETTLNQIFKGAFTMSKFSQNIILSKFMIDSGIIQSNSNTIDSQIESNQSKETISHDSKSETTLSQTAITQFILKESNFIEPLNRVRLSQIMQRDLFISLL